MTAPTSQAARSRGWGRRWASVGFHLGTAAALGMGCRSADLPAPDPHLPVYTGLYPGLKARALPAEPLTAAVASPVTDDSDAPAGPPAESYTASCPGLRPEGPVPYSVAAAAAGRGRTEHPIGPGLAAGPPSPVWPVAGTAPSSTNSSAPSGDLPVAAGPVETIDLGVALRLAGVNNPTINLARERIREALAGQLGARSMLLPTATIGGNYHYHSGPLQASYGQIRYLEEQSLYLGFGARTLAAESVAFPGVRLFAHLGDAVLEPLAARQLVTARQFDARATQNAILLDVATAYLRLVGAEARLEVFRRGETEGGEVVRLTVAYAKAGQGRRSDADRATAFEELLHRQTRRAEEDVAVASAELCRLLNLDPSAGLRTPGGAVDMFRLIPEDNEIEALVAAALAARPEVVARRADVTQATIRVRQEKVRPFVPTLSVGFSGGLFGGGGSLVAYQSSPLRGRTDFDVLAVWNIQNLGFGNLAQVRRTRAVVGEATAEYDAAVNLIRRQVVEAVADTRAAARRVEIARGMVGMAAQGFQLVEERIRNSEGRPIELMDSFRQLLEARQELVSAVVDFDVAQFRLYVAIGSDPIQTPADPSQCQAPLDLASPEKKP